MKKNLILAVTAAMLVGQAAHAAKTGGGREAEAPGARAAHTEASKLDAVEAARKGPEALKTLVAEVKKASLVTRMSAAQEANLMINLANPEAQRAWNEAIKQLDKKETEELGKARLEALSNAKAPKADPAALFKTAEQKATEAAEAAFWNLTVFAGKQAEGWTNVELRGNMTFMLKTANDIMARGTKSVAEAMVEAQGVISKPVAEGGRAVRLSFEDINKFCNKI